MAEKSASQTLTSIFYYVIYACGLVYTAAIIGSNFRAYFKYASTFSVRQLVNPSAQVSFLERYIFITIDFTYQWIFFNFKISSQIMPGFQN